MERALHERDQIGVEDFVLLEDHHSPEAFVDNLRKRFNADLIYTYIGPVLVSVNPYKELSLYSKPSAFEYKGHNYYEQPPHVFALINEALTSMVEETKDQCILISGESGSGKTEASKKLLQYIGFVCDGDDEADGVRDRLIQSNPVLEAFGNAKTTRNDNSSRFGKYMDVQFNFLGKPSGGHIRNYLLEKSRVVAQSAGECNFHIFHLLLAGATDDMLKRLCLQRDPSSFNYTKQSGHKRAGMRDGDHFHAVLDAMTTVGFNSDELEDVMAIVAAILHLGNISFLQRRDCDGDEGSHCRIDTADQHVQLVAQVLDIPVAEIHKAFTHRTIEARTDVVTTKLSVDQGTYARDALSKAVYDRLFSWLVNRLNTSLASETTDQKHLLLGILDIYGFEVFTNNSFEQFCINYCNEKLQQLFIELTLKSEQEEYLAEGIAWEPVEYFNNKIICDMIELKHTGIISLLDEECMRPGEASDLTFLDKMNSSLRCHPHFMSHQTADNKTRKTINRDEFRLMHYAGEVTYSVKTFIDKNNDLLYRDLKEVMSKTSNRICQELFPTNELVGKKMPETVSTQFKRSLDQLMNILMSKEPSYVRCIKPNDTKQAWKFDGQLVAHQVKYLGLMENLRVRRAGFAYRRPFLAFLQRYKSLCPSTWPAARGPARHAVDTLMQHMGFTGGDDYSLGKTKIFIRLPKTIFQVEDAFQMRKHELATILSKTWKGHRERVKYIQMRGSAIVIAKHVRGLLARKAAERRRWAVKVIRRFIVGFATRNDSETEVNRRFVAVLRCEWLLRLSRGLPATVLDRQWPPAPPVCQLADQQLRQLHRRWMVRRYVRQMTPDTKYVLEQKVLAERLFKGKKSSYEMSVPDPFRQSRLTEEMERDKSSVYSVVSRVDDTKVHYCAPVVKYDRHGYKPRNRWFVVTSSGIHVVEAADKPKLKDHFTFSNVNVIVTAESDNLILFKKPQPENNGKEKGDLILLASNVIETVTKLAELTDEKIPITIADSSTLTHDMRGGKEGRIELCKGPSNSAHKEKEGYLVINYS